jgi:hypothetical protein
MPVDVHRRLTGIRFKKEQLRQMRAIWEHRAWSDVDLAQGRWPGSRDGGENSGGGAEDEGEDEGEDEEEGIDEEDEYEAEEGEDDEDDEDIEGGVEEQEDDDDGDGSVGQGAEDEYQEEDWFDNAGSAVDELLQLVFQLSITFSTEEFVDSQPSSSLLVYFSGILGFSPDARSFLPAKKYTPHLSALIYIQRLLFPGICLTTPTLSSSWHPSTFAFPAASAFRRYTAEVHDYRFPISFGGVPKPP